MGSGLPLPSSISSVAPIVPVAEAGGLPEGGGEVEEVVVIVFRVVVSVVKVCGPDKKGSWEGDRVGI